MNKRWLAFAGVLLLSFMLVGGALAASRAGAPKQETAGASPWLEPLPAAPQTEPAPRTPAFIPLLEEHFDGGAFPPPGWTVVNLGGDCVWTNEQGEPYPEGNLTAGYDGFADADSDACGGGTTMDTALVSPIFDLSASGAGTGLEFASEYRHIGAQIASVEILNPGVITWTEVWSTTGNNSNGWVFIDLTPYLGYTTNQVRFRFRSPAWNGWWQVDDVWIAPPMPDLALGHEAPAYAASGAPIPYTVTLRNLGPLTTTALTLTSPIPPGAAYISGTLTCFGGGLCGYDAAKQEVVWLSNGLPPSGSITVTFVMTAASPDVCLFLPGFSYVVDNAGLYLEERSDSAVVPQVFYYTDFEGGPGTVTGNGWTWGAPDPQSAPRGPLAAYNGRMLWGTNLAGGYRGGETLTATLDLRSVPPSPSGVFLAWKQWMDLAPGGQAVVRIGPDVYSPYIGMARTWEEQNIELSPYLGQVVTVTFEVQGANTIPIYSGWYIDSLAVVEGCPFVAAGWEQGAPACPGDAVTYPIFTHNGTYVTQTLNLNLSGNNWLSALSSSNVPLSPGAGRQLTLTVQVPAATPYGSMDYARITAVSAPDVFTNVFTITTWVSDHWEPGVFAPVAAMDGAAVSFNNQTLYFPGGLTETFKFDPMTKNWLPLAPQPAPAYSANEACLGTDANGASVVVLFPNTAAASPALHIYDINNDTWSVAPFSGTGFPLDGVSVTPDPANNLCYLSGGAGIDQVVTNTLYAFSPAGNTFTPLSPMPEGRARHASWMTADGRLCMAGGIDISGIPLNSTRCYDPASDTWEALNASFGHLPLTGLWGMAHVQPSPAEVWLMGGSLEPYYGLPVNAIADTIFWDGIALTWTLGSPLPVPTYLASADIQQGEAYLIGGSHPGFVNNTPQDMPTDDNMRFRSCQAGPLVQADLWLNKIADPPVAAVDIPFTYTLEVGNNGPSWANNVTVEDYLPAGMTVTLPTAGPSCSVGGGVFTCTLGSIPPGGMAQIVVQASSAVSGTRVNYASVSAAEPDPDLNNNLAAAQSYITRQAVQSPLIFDVTPAAGINISDTVITITGMNFQTGLTVTLSGVPLAHLLQNSGLLQALVPAGFPPGTYDVSVINPDGRYDTAVNAFTVYGDTSPRVYDVFPKHGANDMPMGLLIAGENFVPGTTAILSGSLSGGTLITVALGGNYFINGNLLMAFVPKGVLSGTYDLLAFNPDGRLGVLPQAYTVVDANQTDLYGEPGDLWTDPYTVRSGQIITVGATVRRQGGMSNTMSNVGVAFYLGDPASGGALLGTASTGPMPGRGFNHAAISVDLTSVPPGYYDLYAVIDPADQVAEFDETNNVLSYTLAVLPLNPDTAPPVITNFRIDGGSQSTRDVQVTLELSATDDTAPAYMFFIEYAYLQALGSWWPVNLSGWQPYAAVQHAALYATPGVHYVQAWVADAAGNISAPSFAWINLLQTATPIGKEEMHPYRLRLAAGESVRVRLTSGTGDADLYVFAPDNTFVGSSENSTPVDEVAFTAAQSGIYQIEVEGYAAASTYTLEVLSGSSLLRHTPAPAGIQVPKQRGRNRPILSVTEEPSSNAGLETVPDTLYTINLPLIVR